MNNTFGDYLVVLTRVGDKVIIKRTWKKDADKFPVGSEILEVNGRPTEMFIQDTIAPYISSSTEYVRKDLASSMLLRGFPGSTFTIKIRKSDGKEFFHSLTHALTKYSFFYPKPGVYLDEKQRGVFEF